MNATGRPFDDFGYHEVEDTSESAYPSDTESSSTATSSEVKGPAVRNTLLNREEFVPMPKTSPKPVEDSDAQESKVAESKQAPSSKKSSGKATSSTGASSSAPRRRRGRKTASPTSDKASTDQVKDSTSAPPPSQPKSGKVGKIKKKPTRHQAKRQLLLDLIELVDTYPH